MKANKFYSKLVDSVKNRNDIQVKKYKLNYKEGSYDFYKIQSKNISKKDKILLIRAGIHGEEIAGPISLLWYFNKILDYAHHKNVKLIIYPLGNPSGFENNLRYNIDNDEGDEGSNDFMRYELKSGKFIGDLKISNEYKNWYWASDKKLKVNLPIETLLMHKLLKEDPLKQILGCLDLHQDYITKNVKASAYHYSFGNLKVYKKIINEIEKYLPTLKNRLIGAGFNEEIDQTGKLIQKNNKQDAIRSDRNGFIIRHDGTLPDLMYRLGSKYCVTVETTGKTPLEIACKINLIWIFGLIDLIEKS